MIAVGIDPGLRTTGIVALERSGPGLPKMLGHVTVRVPERIATDDARADAMATLVEEWVRFFPVADEGQARGRVVIEAFGHRPWLMTADGQARRVPTSSAMGRLIGRLMARLSDLEIIEVSPSDTKRGWDGRWLPAALRNRHERDAWLAANYGLGVATEKAR